MLPATSTASQTLATRNRSSPIVDVHRPDHTISTARSFSGRKVGGSLMSTDPDAAFLVLEAHG